MLKRLIIFVDSLYELEPTDLVYNLIVKFKLI